MTAWLRMLWFHVRQFAKVGYFVHLTVAGTISACLLQRLGAGSGASMDPVAWLRAAEIGLWTTCTASAGIIGFQRHQGTLAPILVGRRPAAESLSALVAAAATFGLLAFPLAGVLTALLGGPVRASAATAVGALLVWAGATAASLAVASLFVLTPHAITFEVLLLVPLVFASGMLGFPAWLPHGVAHASLVVPFSGGVHLLAGSVGAPAITAPAWALAAASVASTCGWLLLARAGLARCLHQARAEATLEVL